ncbi:hypothetical protein AAFF_G00283100 [Aldrovandia affinis]|uniref:Uncharacterized protein n=1 Tax=Aldrovandia affinis TaxID=143900 RepID=A0AAD7TAB4_9TELE|nr:hypothetical protein AAFF_G00283100 [Aldrovandia affinis]
MRDMERGTERFQEIRGRGEERGEPVWLPAGDGRAVGRHNDGQRTSAPPPWPDEEQSRGLSAASILRCHARHLQCRATPSEHVRNFGGTLWERKHCCSLGFRIGSVSPKTTI